MLSWPSGWLHTEVVCPSEDSNESNLHNHVASLRPASELDSVMEFCRKWAAGYCDSNTYNFNHACNFNKCQSIFKILLLRKMQNL